MKFFFRKKDERKTYEFAPRTEISLSGRAYNRFQDRDCAIKIWVPESAKTKIDEICSYLDTSASDFIRQVLFVHIYGRTDFLGLTQMRHPSIVDSHISTGIRFSTPPSDGLPFTMQQPVAPKQKIDSSFKVWVPAKFSSDLGTLAIRHGETISSYVRKVFLTHLFGTLPFNPTLLTGHPPPGEETC